jgi:hypothetical protein
MGIFDLLGEYLYCVAETVDEELLSTDGYE